MYLYKISKEKCIFTKYCFFLAFQLKKQIAKTNITTTTCNKRKEEAK